MPLAELVPALAFLSPLDSIRAMVCRYLAIAASVLRPSCGPEELAGLPGASGVLPGASGPLPVSFFLSSLTGPLPVSVFLSSLALPSATAPGSLPCLASFMRSAAFLMVSSDSSSALAAFFTRSEAALTFSSAVFFSKSFPALFNSI